MFTVRSKKDNKIIQQRSLKGFITVALAKSNYNEMFLSIYYIVKVLNKRKNRTSALETYYSWCEENVGVYCAVPD